MDLTAHRTAHDGYATLAPLYDEFIAHPGYRHWVRAIEATARTVGVGGVRLLDVGCGTGRSFAPLLERGYLVAGCEPVGAMLAQARRRSPRRVRITHGLVAAAPAGPFDLVLALNDVLQCIPTPGELRDTLAEIAARLAGDGVFAFDVTPPRPHARQFAERVVRRTARARFEWRPADPAGEVAPGVHRAELRLCRAGGAEAVTVHRQRTIAAGELATALASARLRVAAVRGCDNAGRLAAADEDAFKHIYFCRLTHPRRGEEVPDAAGAQAAPQGRRHAVGRQDGLIGREGAARAAAPAPAAEAGDGR
jgi:SAM-dependent methyltransferase